MVLSFDMYLMMMLVHSMGCLYFVVVFITLILLLLSVMQFLSEGNQCNLQNIQFVGPYHVTHEEPTQEELQHGKRQTHRLLQLLLDNTYVICGKIFNYRVNKSESFLQNLHDFFSILIYRKLHFYYSPQYGFSFWPNELGFISLKAIDVFFQEESMLHVFFEDYITETTTFVRYHNQYRFDYMFGEAFRLQFIKKCISSLIEFGDSLGIKWLMISCIRSALDMLYIRRLSN